MSEVPPSPEVESTHDEGFNSTSFSGVDTDTLPASRQNPTRNPRRPNTATTNLPRDYAGVTPKIGGILALHSEYTTNKVN